MRKLKWVEIVLCISILATILTGCKDDTKSVVPGNTAEQVPFAVFFSGMAGEKFSSILETEKADGKDSAWIEINSLSEVTQLVEENRFKDIGLKFYQESRISELSDSFFQNNRLFVLFWHAGSAGGPNFVIEKLVMKGGVLTIHKYPGLSYGPQVSVLDCLFIGIPKDFAKGIKDIKEVWVDVA